jgi:hypothetical protein
MRKRERLLTVDTADPHYLRLQRMAFHKAGHVVACVRFQIPCDRILVLGENPSNVSYMQGDYYDLVGDRKRINRERAEQSVIALLAGYAAQVKYNPRGTAKALQLSSADFTRAKGILGEIAPNLNFESFRHQARDLVNENWAAIEGIVKDLQFPRL